jgi:hypothetical protein
VFTKKQNLNYAVFIINQAQGRGLDFNSSVEIEEHGVVFLLVSELPSTFLQYRQILGCTGRIGNKGQYSVIIFDREAKNAQGDVYVGQLL